MKGYRLHDQRIASSGGSDSMRTIKYELVDPDTPEGRHDPKLPLRDKIADAVFADYRKLYGPLNFSDFLEHRSDPSVLEFWLLTLKLGVFYGSSRDKLPAEFDAYRNEHGQWQSTFASMRPALRRTLNQGAWRNFMIASQRGLEAKSAEQREQIILRLLDQEHAKDEIAIAQLKPLAEHFAAEFLEADDKKAFKTELFGVTMPEQESKQDFSMTWVVNPAWEEVDWQPGDDPTALIETVMSRHAGAYGDEPRMWQVAMGVGNNGGYLNNILGTGGRQLADGQTGELAAQMALAFGFGTAARRIVAQRLETLATYLQALGKPQMMTTWSDYRSSFNGTLESWYSNRVAKHDTTLRQLDDLNTALDDLSAALRDHEAQNEAASALAGELRQIVAEARASHLITAEDSRTIRLLLGELRVALNEWRQRSGINDKRLAKDGAIGKVLGTNVQSSSMFFGVGQQQRYERLLHLKQDTLKQTELLTDVWRWALGNLDGTALVTDRSVSALATASRSAEHRAVRAVYAQIEDQLETSFAKQQGRDRFYISPYDRQKGLRRLPFTALRVDQLLGGTNMPRLLEHLRSDITAPNLLRDVTRLSASLLALALTAVDDDGQFTLSDRSLCTERQQKLLERSSQGQRIDKPTLQVLQSYMHAELMGAATLLTRRTVLERATVQGVNGDQVRLAYETVERSGNTFRRYLVLHTRYHDEQEPEPLGRPLQVARQSYNLAAGDFGPIPEPVGSYLAIRSSKYQIQFLEWLLNMLPKRRTQLRAAGAFTIAERTLHLDWSGDIPRLQAKDDPRVFISQPFTLIPREPARELQPETQPCFMGVDVGEYGLAVHIIRCEGARVESLHQAFMTDPQHRVLASGNITHQTPARATINAPDTHLTRLSESLTGTYRNQLHALMLRYNAWPVVDWEISNFGRGPRIAKIYSALKRSDVKSRDNQLQTRQAWGRLLLNQHRWAKEATAAGTSQTCSRCQRWAGLLIADTEIYPLQPHRIQGLKVASLGNSQVVCLSDADQLKGIDLRRAIHAATRPPLGGIALQLGPPETTSRLDETWKQRRGNMAVFICPFTDCHHLADADLQAALNIALRGYAKMQSDGKLAKAADLIAFAGGLDYEPVPLQVP